MERGLVDYDRGSSSRARSRQRHRPLQRRAGAKSARISAPWVPSYINTFQRGPQESVWETVPQPTCDTFKYGGKNGYLDLFTGDSSLRQAVEVHRRPRRRRARHPGRLLGRHLGQGAGQGREVAATVGQGREDGRLPALLVLRQVLQEDRQLHQPDHLPGRHRQGQRALPAVLVLRLGRRHRHLRRLGLAHRRRPVARRLPEPDGGLRAEHATPT